MGAFICKSFSFLLGDAFLRINLILSFFGINLEEGFTAQVRAQCALPDMTVDLYDSVGHFFNPIRGNKGAVESFLRGFG